MRDRARRVAMQYLSQAENPNQDTQPVIDKPKEDDPSNTGENKKRELVREYLGKFYPSIIYSFLKKHDIPDLLLLSQATVSRFHKSDSALVEFDGKLSSLKSKVLSAVGDIAELDQDSLTDKFMEEVLGRRMTDAKIEDFVKSQLQQLRAESQNALKSAKGLLISQ